MLFSLNYIWNVCVMLMICTLIDSFCGCLYIRWNSYYSIIVLKSVKGLLKISARLMIYFTRRYYLQILMINLRVLVRRQMLAVISRLLTGIKSQQFLITSLPYYWPKFVVTDENYFSLAKVRNVISLVLSVVFAIVNHSTCYSLIDT